MGEGKMNRKAIIGGLVAVVVALLLGLLVGTRIQPRPAGAETVKPATYAMNVVVSGVPFWTDTRGAWQAIDKARPDVVTSFGGPLDTDAQEQIQQIEAAIASNVDGIVVAPADSAALAPVINRAVARNIPVVTLLVDSPTSKRLAYVTSELEGASVRVGTAVLGKGPVSGKAIIVYAQAGNEEQEARRRGFEQLAREHPGLQIVGVVQDNYDENRGAEQIKALLSRNPDIRYIFGANSRSAVGAVSALRELHYPQGRVTVTGWDTDQDVLDLVRSGWVAASVAQQSAYMTQVAFNLIDAAHRNYLYPAGRNFQAAGIRPAPEQITVPVTVVDRNNVAGFYPAKPAAK
jgi:ribose transport system substrate-binding protein